MNAGGFPEIGDLLPHAGPMRLLGRVLAHEPVRTVCALDPAASDLFRAADGSVPAWLALEWMAQCAAAHGGLVARAQGRAPSPGMLVGAKRIAFERARFEAGDALEVEARWTGGAGGLAAFECALREGGELVASGSIQVFVSDALAQAPRAAT